MLNDAVREDEAGGDGLPETAEAIEEIRRGQRAGRQLVPLLGAGISVESGYPPTRSIINYLAAVKYYFENNLYLPQPLLSEEVESNARGVYDWSTHLKLFGWPDRFELTEQLWDHFQKEALAGRGADAPLRRRLWMAIKQALRSEWTARGYDTPEQLLGLRDFLLEHREEVERWIGEAPASAPDKAAARMLNDPEAAEVDVGWRDLLRSVTDSNHNNVDSLFQSFNRGRLPGTSHRFIAFLTRLLRCNLVLSMNFDDLIEQAFYSEKVRHRVFDIWQGAALPDASLLQDRTSLVKLHGGAYGLRVGESLDDPLGDDEKDHLISYLPFEPMLLVLGYAGADRRIMDFVRAFLEDRRRRRECRDPDHDLPDVAWIHFEPKGGLSKSVVKLQEDYGEKAFRTWRTHNVGGFLAGLYARMTSAHPTTTNFYEPIFHRPAGVDLGWFLGGEEGSYRPDSGPDADGRPVQLFSPEAPDGLGVDSCSIAMSDFAARKGATHQTLWIDLGTLPSVELVLTEIIRRCRRYDSDLPPILLAIKPTADPADSFEECRKAAGRVHEALKRGHYVLVLDNLGAFGRPPTSHHGIATSCARGIGDEVGLLATFLHILVAELDEASDSYICLSMTEPTPRFNRRRRSSRDDDQFDLIGRKIEDLGRRFRTLPAPKRDLIWSRAVPNRPDPALGFDTDSGRGLDKLVDSIWGELVGRPPLGRPRLVGPAPDRPGRVEGPPGRRRRPVLPELLPPPDEPGGPPFALRAVHLPGRSGAARRGRRRQRPAREAAAPAPREAHPRPPGGGDLPDAPQLAGRDLRGLLRRRHRPAIPGGRGERRPRRDREI